MYFTFSSSLIFYLVAVMASKRIDYTTSTNLLVNQAENSIIVRVQTKCVESRLLNKDDAGALAPQGITVVIPIPLAVIQIGFR